MLVKGATGGGLFSDLFGHWFMWGRTGGVWTPYPQVQPPYHRPIFFSGTPAPNSDFCPHPQPSDPRPNHFFLKSPCPHPTNPLAPVPPVLPHVYTATHHVVDTKSLAKPILASGDPRKWFCQYFLPCITISFWLQWVNQRLDYHISSTCFFTRLVVRGH